jgi:thioredoxin-related protein
MKNILLALIMIAGTMASSAQEIKWMTIDEALAAQKKVGKPIFMDVYTDWCGPCKMLDRNTFSNPEFAKYIADNYYAVKFNGEGNSAVNYKGTKYTNPDFDPTRKGRNAMHQFTAFLKVQGYPSMYVLDSKGEIKSPIVGYYTADQLLPLIKL